MSFKYLSVAFFGISVALSGSAIQAFAETKQLLNVSYDPTRKLYEAYNGLFSKYWKQKTGDDVVVTQSHGGSGKQARSVIDGLQADVVTLALAFDIDAISEKSKTIPPKWQERFAHYSTPYTSTIVFLVRKGNPKNIHDWDDLVKSGVQVITPNPKTSGGARWNYLAAYGYADKKFNGDKAKIKEFLHRLFLNVPIYDTGARGATTTFVQRGIGDVLLAWENEAFLAQKELGAGQFDIVAPSVSVLAEPPVAVVDKVALKKGNEEVAKAYLSYLYTSEAQKLIAENYYRPTDKKIAAEYADRFPVIKQLLTIRDFGGWKQAQKTHFDEGALFDIVSKKD